MFRELNIEHEATKRKNIAKKSKIVYAYKYTKKSRTGI